MRRGRALFRALIMKKSKYIVSLQHEGINVLFNTRTKSYLIVTPSLLKSFNSMMPEELLAHNNRFFKQLLKYEFIIEDDFDELEALRTVSNREDYNESKYHMIINPTLDCNCRCWYCFEKKHIGSIMNREVLSACKNHISRTLEQKPSLGKFALSFFGGEPLLHYFDIAAPIINHLQGLLPKEQTEISITTNGILLNRKIIDHLVAVHVQNLQITFDGDSKSHNKTRCDVNKTPTYRTIVSNIHDLNSAGIKVVVRFNYTLKNIYDFQNTLNDLYDVDNPSLLFLSVNRVWQDISSKASDDEKQRMFAEVDRLYQDSLKHGFSPLPQYNRLSLSQSCYADKNNQCLINYDGGVFKCNARDFSSQRQLGVLKSNGVIEWNEKYQYWMLGKFCDPICNECSIFPLCGRGCRRILYETRENHFCVYGDDSIRKLSLVHDILNSL